MSDTPETDKAKCKFTSLFADNEDAYWVHLTVARKLERERDAALIGYNECRATIEDARVALNAHEYEGLLLASLRIQDQLTAERALADRLAEAMQGVMLEERDLPVASCRGFIDFDQAILALAAWKEARSE